jgi:hypothetical protein
MTAPARAARLDLLATDGSHLRAQRHDDGRVTLTATQASGAGAQWTSVRLHADTVAELADWLHTPS